MNLNFHILADELKEYNLSYDVSMPPFQREITSCEVLDSESLSYDCSTLYICTNSLFAILTEYKHLPHHLMVTGTDFSQTTVLNCSILTIRDNVSPYTILKKINALFLKYDKWELSLLQSIINKSTLQDFFNAAMTVFPNPMYMLDTSYVLILFAGKLPEDLSNTVWELFWEKGYYNLDNPISSPEIYEKSFTYHRAYWMIEGSLWPLINANIYINNEYVSCMTLTDVNEPLTMRQFVLFEYVRELFQKYLPFNQINNLFTIQGIAPYQILEGKSVTSNQISRFLQSKNWSENELYYTITFRSREKSSESSLTSALFCVRNYFPQGFSFIHKKYVICIITETDYSYWNNEYISVLEDIRKLLPQYIAAISMPFSHFQDLNQGFQQGKAALSQITSDQFFRRYHDCIFSDLYQVISKTTNPQIYCDPRIILLKEYDKQRNSNLVNTLYQYLQHSKNAVKTANHMYLHRNTLNLRLTRIEEISGIDLSAPCDSFHLLLSCLILLQNKE